ncbi:hypothetical protein [Streptomyces smaragdinus]|nr:hypothetical protein [Streptomyces smaragdinus]
MNVDLRKLEIAGADWKDMTANLVRLRDSAYSGLLLQSDAARWEGVNAGVTKDFVRQAVKEFADLHNEAASIHAVLDDAATELTVLQRRVRDLTAQAGKGEPTKGIQPLVITEMGDGTVQVAESICRVEQHARQEDLIQWYADAIKGAVAHAAEIDAAVKSALAKAHGRDPYNAGHATYTSLDEEQLPVAVQLATLGGDASPQQRAKLRRLWVSLGPEARADLWSSHKDSLLAAGIFSPQVKRLAPDGGSGTHDSESPGFDDRLNREKLRAIAEGGDWMNYTDAARHMVHYLENSGDPLDLPVDKMMHDDPGFRTHIDQALSQESSRWREEALKEYRKSGGRPVAIPVESRNQTYYFPKESEPNWYYAVGSTGSNITGVVTVTPAADGQPQVSLDYQVNAWDRYNWDSGKSVDIGPLHIPDEETGRLHRTGMAQEFDVSGNSSVKHYDLGSGSLPAPDEPGLGGSRMDPGRDNSYR